jgi:Glycine/D-amino acid oxidases (deaminating)
MTMAKLTHPDSLYASEQGPQSSHSVGALPKRIRHLIIGGGLTGLQCGCQLAARGEEVLLLEQGPVAWGASGRNGGQVLPGFAWGPSQLASALGEERARRLWQKSRGAVQLVAEQPKSRGFWCNGAVVNWLRAQAMFLGFQSLCMMPALGA